MNMNYENESTYTDVNANEGTSNKSFKKTDILVALLCIILAFALWCYALYLDDPIIEKDVTVKLVLLDGADGEHLEYSEQKLSVYGKKSILDSVEEITLSVSRAEFNGYGDEVSVAVEYPDGIDGETDKITVKLARYD